MAANTTSGLEYVHTWVLVGKTYQFPYIYPSLVTNNAQFVGKGDIDETLLEVLDKALEAHELVKVRVLETASSTFEEISDSLCKGTGAQFVGKTGHIITVYRESKKNKTIVLPHK